MNLNKNEAQCSSFQVTALLVKQEDLQSVDCPLVPALEADLNTEKYLGTKQKDFFYSEYLKMPTGKFQTKFSLSTATEVRIQVANPRVKISILKGSVTLAKTSDFDKTTSIPHLKAVSLNAILDRGDYTIVF